MTLQATLQEYRNLLKEELDKVDALLENSARLANMIASEDAVPQVIQLASVPSLSQQPHAFPRLSKRPRVRCVNKF